jgi:CDP-diacylglycerol pyrophosphatase
MSRHRRQTASFMSVTARLAMPLQYALTRMFTWTTTGVHAQMKELTQMSALAAILAVMIAAFAGVALSDRDALRRIVQTECMASYRSHSDPSPCERLVFPDAGDEQSGYAVLKDRKAGAHFLVIPIRTLAGIESPELLDPASTNYVAAAWKSRDALERWTGRTLPRNAVGLAINPRLARSQDQLHIHMECVGPMLYHALDSFAEQIGSTWTPVWIASRRYMAKRISEPELEQNSPLRLPADDISDAPRDRGAYTLVVVGRSFTSGPGFILLAGTRVPGGEGLLDATCAVASSAPLQASVNTR